jgi:hypothetical protein
LLLSPAPPPPPADPALPLHLLTRDQLSQLWRRTVDRLTAMSVELHSLQHDAPPEHVQDVESRLAYARRTLVEIELAMQRRRMSGS